MDLSIVSLSMLEIMWFRTKEIEIVEIGVEKDVDLGSWIKDSLFPNVLLRGGGTLLIIQCCVSGQHDSLVEWFYMSDLPMKTKLNVNIGLCHVSKEVISKTNVAELFILL